MVQVLSRFVDAYRAFTSSTSKDNEQAKRAARDAIRASFDSVMRTPENARHWQWADLLDADASLTPEVRKEIRSQARYECQENNSYGKGISQTLAQDTIGTGPKLQMQLNDADYNFKVERLFQRWAKASCFNDKLLTMRLAKLVDGENVARLVSNEALANPIKLDLQLIECDQLEAPTEKDDLQPQYIDGVYLDTLGNPTAYDILRYHPGSEFTYGSYLEEYDTYARRDIIHMFRRDRPGQHRGISEFAASLPLFAFLRRFTLATIAAAETAANVSQVLETDAPLPVELEEEMAVTSFDKYMDAVNIDRNSATVLPNQWKLHQVTAEHPTTTYEMFKKQIINEIARTVSMPRNKAAADSSDYNYASGRLDHLDYHRLVRVEREHWETTCLDRVLAAWLFEGALSGELPHDVSRQILRNVERADGNYEALAYQVEHSWFWDAVEDADEEKAASAQAKKLANGTTHRAREYACRGMDVDVEDQRAAETYGMTVREYRRALAGQAFTNGNAFGEEQQNTEAAPSQNRAEEDQSQSAD